MANASLDGDSAQDMNDPERCKAGSPPRTAGAETETVIHSIVRASRSRSGVVDLQAFNGSDVWLKYINKEWDCHHL